MHTPYYEVLPNAQDFGVQISYVTTPGGYRPLHWHEEVEILYPLNGESTITIEKKKYKLLKKHLLVVESSQVHSTFTKDRTSMFICIHVSRQHMEKYIPNLALYKIHCIPDDIPDSKFPSYLSLCQLLETITELYIKDAPAYSLETEGLILQIFARLIRDFSTTEGLQPPSVDPLTAERIRTVITYVSEHFSEPIPLSNISGELGLGKEYFCRFFKKNMGMPFLQYVNEVRCAHIYRGLENTDTPIAELMEENGFTNQKLFNRTFKSIYGCTPSDIRKGKDA